MSDQKRFGHTPAQVSVFCTSGFNQPDCVNRCIQQCSQKATLHRTFPDSCKYSSRVQSNTFGKNYFTWWHYPHYCGQYLHLKILRNMLTNVLKIAYKVVTGVRSSFVKDCFTIASVAANCHCFCPYISHRCHACISVHGKGTINLYGLPFCVVFHTSQVSSSLFPASSSAHNQHPLISKPWEVSKGEGEKKPSMCLPFGHILNIGFICRPYSLPSCSSTFARHHEFANLQYSFLKIVPSLHSCAFTCEMSHLWTYSFWFPVLCCFGYQH